MSTGLKRVLIEGATWLSVMVSVFVSIYFYDDIQAVARQAFANGDNYRQAAQRSDTGRTAMHTSSRNGSDIESNSRRLVHLQARRGGHFLARAYINGRPINVMVDTGATSVALTYKDAEAIGLFVRKRDFTRRTRTANGFARSAPVMLDRVRIGDIEVDDVRASVSEPGRLHITLLGMTFLSKLSKVEIQGDQLVLTE